jgi:Protein of unknown function DUF262
MPKIRFGEETLGLIVRNRQGLRVPINQRSYAWRPSHVEDLLTDLNGAITANAEEYFLGSIIVVAPDKADFIEVYDGQQRIATTMILLAAIRDFFFLNLKDTREAGVIATKSLISVERRGKEIPQPPSTTELSQAAAFLDPGMRELRYPRTLRVDFPRFFRLHFCFESRRLRGFFDTRDRSPPCGPSSRRRALLAQWTVAAGFFRRAIHTGTYTVPAIQHCALAQRFSRGAAENILRRVVRERAAQKSGAAALRGAFHRSPTLLPGTVKIHATLCGCLHRCVIRVVAIGNDLPWRTT